MASVLSTYCLFALSCVMGDGDAVTAMMAHTQTESFGQEYSHLFCGLKLYTQSYFT